jgi:hypothetical protein
METPPTRVGRQLPRRIAENRRNLPNRPEAHKNVTPYVPPFNDGTTTCTTSGGCQFISPQIVTATVRYRW